MRETRLSGSEGGVADNGHPYPYNPGCFHLFCGGGVPGLAPGACWRWRLRGIGPALAGNVGAGWAFALSREGDQDFDVPMLAPARARCRFVEAQEGSRMLRPECPNGALHV